MERIAREGSGVVVLLRPHESPLEIAEAVRSRAIRPRPREPGARRAGAAHLRHRRADPARPRRAPHARAVRAEADARAFGLRPRSRRVRGLSELRNPTWTTSAPWRATCIARDLRFAIVASRFNDADRRDSLIRGAVDALLRHGASEKQIEIIRVPGAFDLPLVARRVAASQALRRDRRARRRDPRRHAALRLRRRASAPRAWRGRRTTPACRSPSAC